MAWLLAVLLAAVLAARAPAADPLSAHEDEIKAAYLYNVAKFVEWPAETLPNPDAPLTIGVLSDEGFARVLEAALVGKRAQGRALAVRRFATAADVQPTQILYFGNGTATGVSESLALLGRAPVLTVGEEERFIRSGGILNFYQEEDTLRFEVCPERAQKLGLKISSKLLRLARIVAER